MMMFLMMMSQVICMQAHQKACDPDAVAETIVVELTATDSYPDANGDIINVVPHAVVAEQVLKAIQPRLDLARKQNDQAVITGLLDIQSQMEALRKMKSKKLVTSKTSKTKSSKVGKTSNFSPPVNEFALGFILTTFLTSFMVLGCFMFYRLNRTTFTKAKPSKKTKKLPGC